MVKVLICPDKFKGSLTAREACDAVGEGLTKTHRDIELKLVPLADGGDGTCGLLTEWQGGKTVKVEVSGPLFTPKTARYGISEDESTAFIEMAEASGLTLLSPSERNPLLTTTLGTGELIADALSRGVKNIILGIGGSATNDAGIGMASALGFDFVGADGEVLPPTGENLIHLRHVRTTRVHPGLRDVKVTALCDVTNPLYGPEGAAYVYGPQKGADKAAVELLDAGLRNFRRVVHKYMRTTVDFAGAGAAGGLGAGARVFLNARIQKGINYLIENTRLEEAMKWADVIITGEGKIDGQTFSGKVVSEVLRLAQKADKPVLAVCGICEVPLHELPGRGVKEVIVLADNETSIETAIQHAAECIIRKVSAQWKDLSRFN